MPIINKQQLIVELSTAEPVLVRVATQVFEENFFLPNVEDMKAEFEKHPVTKEMDAASNDISISSFNYSKTVVGGKSKAYKNLYTFIGFEDAESPADQVRPFLEPGAENGPSYKYIRGSQRDNLTFQFKVNAPNIDAIEESTPIPWLPGLSWVNRIEKGIPGLSKFLNKPDLKGSRSGGGIQVANELRDANFKPIKYMSTIIKNFIKSFN
jgi:hypothetical protein